MIRRIRNFYRFTHSHIRNPMYNILQPADIEYFKKIMKQKSIIQQDLDQYNTDFTNKYKGTSKLVLAPQNIKQLQNLLKYCNQNNLAVVPQGGNTGLVGGNVPLFDQIIVSTKNLNRIEKYDEFNNVISCEAGCILEHLNQYLMKYQYEIPLDLGAKGSCYIGGNVSTHAGGKYFIKYGPLRGNILGLQAVLPSGQILNLRSKLRKDNTGIDLKQLFIGAQGSLGIITNLDIQCVKVDKSKVVVLIKTKSYKQILELARQAKKELGKSLNSMQYMDGFAYNVVFKHLKYDCPLSIQMNQHSLLLQINGDSLDLLTFIPQTNEAILSNNEQQYNSIWKIRQSVASAANRQGLVYKYDVSFDIELWDNFLRIVRQKLKSQNAYIMGYGHIGDGNLHINICLGQQHTFDQRFIIDQVIKNKGSISAEHGVGQHKSQYLHLQKQQRILSIGRQIKQLFDPKMILNPYKLYSN